MKKEEQSSTEPIVKEDYSEEEVKKAKAFVSKEWWGQAGSRAMGSLGKLSKSFLLPIALLPIAGLFIGIGAAIGQIHNAPQGVYTFGSLLNQMGSVCFGNLAVLFLISAIIAYTGDSGSAVLAGFVAFLVFNAMIAALSAADTNHIQYTVDYGNGTTSVFDAPSGYALWQDPSQVFHIKMPDGTTEDRTFATMTDYVYSGMNNWTTDSAPSNWSISGSPTNVVDSYNLLFWHAVPASLYGPLLGINTLNTGVFAGVVVGCLVAYVYNRTYKVNLPTIINFFSGIKFVPIVMFFAIIPMSLLFMIIWPPIGKGLDWFGKASGDLPYGLDSFVFEIFERSLVPFGLHHVYYSPLWWTAAGGGPLSSSAYDAGWQAFSNATGTVKGDISPQMLSAVGDQTMCYAVIGQPSGQAFLTFEDIYKYFHLNLGRFQTGKFPFMMFGLPAAATAMWLAVPKEHRKDVLGIYFSAAITCFLTGITEPIEYTFLFVAPWLFYGVHMPLASLSFLAMGALHVHVSQTVSGGFIDMLIFGVLPFAKYHTNFYWILVLGPLFSVAYFFAFYFLIKWRDVKLPGRDGAVDTLYKKADYQAKKADKKAGKGQDKTVEKASIILVGLGGAENIESVDACASRLRVNVHSKDKVDQKMIKDKTGPSAVLFRGSQCQMIFGGESDVLKSTIKDIMSGKVQAIGVNKDTPPKEKIESKQESKE